MKLFTPNRFLVRNFSLICSLLIVLFFSVGKGWGQVTVTASGGTASATYATLKGAFDAVNAGTHSGIISLSITASIAETASAVLNASGSGSASYTSINISPSGGAWTVSGAITAGSPLIDFNGADNVTIDGLNTGGNSLTISNTTASSTAGTSTLRFIADATNNLIQNCNILGVSTGSVGTTLSTGTILFGSGTSTGNDNNQILNCNIGDGATLPSMAISSVGTSTTVSNDNITVTGNNIFNWFLAGGANAINLANSSAWTISSNKFYQTASRSGATTYQKVIFISNSSGTGFNINNNIIGFASSSGTGMMTYAAGTAARFTAIDINIGASPVSNIQGNTINNINFSTTSGASTLGAAAFNGIVVNAGGVNIGNVTANIIGASTGTATSTSNIYLQGPTSAGYFPIYVTSATNCIISNNIIGAINIVPTTAAATIAFTGISVAGTGSHTITNNQVGNSTASNITLGVIGTTTSASTFKGIESTATGAVLIGAIGAGNVIQNINLNPVATNAFIGIINSGVVSTLNINYNTIKGIIFGATSTTHASTFTGISNTGACTSAININNNNLGVSGTNLVEYKLTATAASGVLIGITNSAAGSTSAVSIQNNDIRGILYAFTGSGAHTYIIQSAAVSSANVAGNTFTNLSINTSGAIIFISHNYAIPATGQLIINNNSIVTAFTRLAAGSITISTSNSTSGTGSINNYTNNNFSNIIVPDNASSTILGFNNTDGGTGSTKTITGNTFNNWHGGTSGTTGTTGSINCMNFSYWNGVSSLSNNTITNITGRSSITGVTLGSSSNAATSIAISGNSINNLKSIGTGGQVLAISCSNTSPLININGNTINNLSSTGASSAVGGITVFGAATTNVYQNVINDLSTSGATAPIALGIQVAGGTLVNVYRNKIYNLSATGIALANTNSAVSGIYLSAGTTVNTYNNLIGGLTAPSASMSDAIRGINIMSTTTSSTQNIYNNTVFLNASSTGANFGTTGIFHTTSTTATTSTLNLQNNIIINNSTPSGTGLTVAYRRSSGAASNLANYASSSNKNLFYAGTPGVSNLIYTDGTSSAQTITNYISGVFTSGTLAPRDANSFTESSFDPATYFVSTTGSNANFLQPANGLNTQAESGGNTIAMCSPDYNGVARPANNGTGYDLGAWEFAGVSPAPVYTNLSPSPALTTQCSATARVINIDITTTSGTITGATLNYSHNGIAQTAITMTNSSGNTWTGTMNAPTTVNATVIWSITATNSLGISNAYSGTSFSDAPNTGITATATASPSTVCDGSNSSLSLSISPSFYFNEGFEGVTFPPSNWTLINGGTGNNWASGTSYVCSGSKSMQYSYNSSNAANTWMITPAQNLIAGNTYYISFNYKSYGSTTSPEKLKVTVGSSNTILAQNLTLLDLPSISNSTCNTANITYTPSVTGSYYFGFNCYTPANFWSLGVDDITISTIQGSGPTPTAYSWSNGTTTLGTVNPLTTTITSGLTYTGTATVNNCPMNASVTPTVNPLPTAPSATNSTQCGSGIPTASVSDNNGYSTPTFKWYNASTGGTLLQTNTSTTYLTSINTTTTFYVAVVNQSTGCESVRTAVTVSVNQPDAISASTSASTICLGQSFTLTAANTASSPTQNYTYSWVCATAGSGATSSNTNNPATITPISSGTFIYTATGVDGVCSAVNTVSITVNPNPIISSAIASPSTVCSGSDISLTATSIQVSSGVATLGNGLLFGTGTTGTFLRQGNTVGNQFKTQYLFLASELQSAGLQAGNITGLTFDVYAAGGGTVSNLTFKLANSNLTNLTTTYVTGLTQVFSVATYPSSGTVQTGLQSITFNTPFNWDGTSNIVLEACAQLATSGTDGTLRSTATSFASTIANNPTTTACASTTGGGTFNERPNFKFNGQVGTNQASQYNWSWNSSPTLSAVTGTTVETNNGANSTTKTYTVTATNASTGCASQQTTSSITINPSTIAPVATNSSHCGSQTPSCSVSGTGTLGNSFVWYTVSTGGTAITGQTTSTLSNYPVASTTTLYVSESNGTCQSSRTPVVITVTAPPSVTATASLNTVCSGSQTVLSATSSNSGYTYSWSNSLGTGSSVTASPITATTYTVTAIDNSGGAFNSCVSNASVVISTNPLPTAVSLSPNSTQNLCLGSIQSIVASGGIDIIYQNGFESGVSDFTPSASASATSNTTYYSGGSKSLLFNTASTSNQYLTFNNVIDLSNSSNVSLTFKHIAALEGQTTSYDYALIEYSSDGGATWTSFIPADYVGTASTTPFNTNVRFTTRSYPDWITTFTGTTALPTNSLWKTEKLNIPSSALTSQFKIRFRYNPDTGTFYYGWLIDDILISRASSTTFSPTTDLYTNAGATTAYTGNPSTVYSKPTANRTYTATATTAAGCSTTASVTINVAAPTTETVASTDYIWKGTTSTAWGTTTNWTQFDGTNYTAPSAAPTSTSVVVIPQNNTCVQNQPLIGSSAISVQDLKIESGATTTLNSGAQLTISGTLTNNGTLTLESGATLVQGSSSTLAGSGTYNVKQAITGDGTTTPSGRFWYLGSPVSLASSSVYFASNAANVVKKRSESTNAWTALSSGSPEPLLVGQGYYTQAIPANSTINFTGGLLNNGAISITNLTRTAGQGFEGFNLVSNPYPSYLNWDVVSRTNVDGTMWYRTHDGTNMVFETYVAGAAGGVGTNLSGNTATKYIPPMQSYWVRVTQGQTSGSLALDNTMRTHFASLGSSTAGLRSTQDDPSLFLRMNLLQANKKDQLIVYVNEQATNGFDMLDGEKMMQAGYPQFYTKAGDKKIVINGLNSAKKQQALPVTIELPTTGVHSFVIEDLEISNGLVWLEDKQEEIIQALEPGTVYQFYANAGMNAERFVLHFQLIDDAVPTNVYNEVNSSANFSGKGANVYAESAGVVVIKLPASAEGVTDIQIRDAAGKLVYAGSMNNLETSVELAQANGIYYVTLSSNTGVEVRKVFIQQ